MNEMEVVHEDLPTNQSVAMTAKEADAVQKVQAALTIARRFPRDTQLALGRIRESCRRPMLAEMAVYAYPRGGKTVTGPTIRLMEAIAQSWGNCDTWVNEVEGNYSEGYSVVETGCWDLETNTRDIKTFRVYHKLQLKDGKTKRLTDPRDVYEMVANYGARRKRACIQAVLPRDVVDFAMKECTLTMRSGGGKEALADRISKMILLFQDLGVSKDMIERRLGHEAKLITEDELVEYRQIYNSLKDGEAQRSDWFDFLKKESVPSDLNEKLKERTK
jgi:hypothetical protein